MSAIAPSRPVAGASRPMGTPVAPRDGDKPRYAHDELRLVSQAKELDQHASTWDHVGLYGGLASLGVGGIGAAAVCLGAPVLWPAVAIGAGVLGLAGSVWSVVHAFSDKNQAQRDLTAAEALSAAS